MDRISRFEIIEKIGEGGMGVVYKARDPQIDRVVAIKLLKEGFDNSEMRGRFVQEARAAGNLQNPYIVTIFELGEHHEPPYIVMEFLVGDPLDKLIKRKAPLPLLRKLELMEALCSGLAAAHRAGIIHRDIKPPNLIVIPDGALKILDFGIARAGASERTKVGVQMGTFNYMPPEQMRGEGVDRRSDIFAVGAVFYEILSYERAFPGSRTDAITRVLTSDPDPLSKLCPGLDPAIEKIVVKALRKDPRDRYQELSEMRREIARVRSRLEREAPDTLVNSNPSTVVVDGVETPGSSRAREEISRRAYSEIDAARLQFDSGDVAGALDRLEQFTPHNDLVAEALAAFRERADDAEREAQRASAIARAVDAANLALEAGDYTGALRKADEALLIDDRSVPAREVRRRARAAIDEQRRQEVLRQRATDAIAEARRMFESGDRTRALNLLTSFEPVQGDVAAVLRELKSVADAMLERERLDEARRREAEAEAAREREAEAEAERQRQAEAEAEAERQREADAARQRKAEAAEAARRREAEAARAREAEAARQREAEAERRREEARRKEEEDAQRARDEEARLAREEAERAAEAEAERQARAEEARRAKAEADRRAREDAARAKALAAEKRAREEEAARVRAEAERQRKAREAEKKKKKAPEEETVIRDEPEPPQTFVDMPPPVRRKPSLPAVSARTAMIAGGALAATLVVGVALYRSSSPAPTPAPTAGTTTSVAPQQPAATTTVLPPPPPGRGTLLIDATPWAQIVSIVDANGNAQPLPPDATTPLFLTLIPGRYDITLRNGRNQTVNATIDSNRVTQPEPVDFGQIEAEDYFRRLGW